MCSKTTCHNNWFICRSTRNGSKYVYMYALNLMLSFTGIAELKNVLRLLKDIVDWEDLGLELGLEYSTIERIEKDYRGQVNSCMRKMLACWLRKEDESVKSTSWKHLIDALSVIGKADVANNIVSALGKNS